MCYYWKQSWQNLNFKIWLQESISPGLSSFCPVCPHPRTHGRIDRKQGLSGVTRSWQIVARPYYSLECGKGGSIDYLGRSKLVRHVTIVSWEECETAKFWRRERGKASPGKQKKFIQERGNKECKDTFEERGQAGRQAFQARHTVVLYRKRGNVYALCMWRLRPLQHTLKFRPRFYLLRERESERLGDSHPQK